MKEKWKDIPGYEGFYQASILGRIKRIAKASGTCVGKILEQGLTIKKYRFVGLWQNNKCKIHQVHRLILKTFVGPCPKKMECRHIDGNPENNSLKNLEWNTRSINQRDRVLHGTSNRGSRNGQSKLTESDILKIKEMARKGILQREIAKIFNVSRQTISDITTKKSWKHI